VQFINRFTQAICLFGLLLPAAHAVPDIQHWQTESGTGVYFVPTTELPMVDVRMVFDAGSARDGDTTGVASMTLGMLSDGAAGMSANEISTAFESIGANYGTSIDRDKASVQLRTLSKPGTRGKAVETLAKVISQPEFPQEDFKREQQRTLIGIQSKKQSPGALADDAFYDALYGDHPYAHPTSGTEESVKRMQREDLVAFHEQYYTAANATIAIVGDLNRSEAEQLARDLTAKLPTGEAAPELPEVEANNTQQVAIDFPSSQTHILIGTPVVQRHDKDYFELYVGNHVLGGSGMVSKLFETIRNEQGLSYSVYSYFFPLQQKGPFVAGLQTGTAQTDAALELLRKEIRSYIKNGPTAEELKASKQNITGGFPLRIDSNSDIVEYLAVIGFYDLPLDYLDTFNDKVKAVTREEIVDAFQRRLDVDDFVTVLVGQQQTSAARNAGKQSE